MTGLYEYRHGCNFGHGPLHQETWEQSYPMILRKHGYMTAIAGKIDLKFYLPVRKKRFCQRMISIGGEPVRDRLLIVLFKIKWRSMQINTHIPPGPMVLLAGFLFHAAKEKKPFCLSISFKAPHKPDQVDPLFNDVYAGKKFAS